MIFVWYLIQLLFFCRLADFLGWESSELVGQSVFDFYHALDNLSLDKSFKSRKLIELLICKRHIFGNLPWLIQLIMVLRLDY